MAHPPGVYLSSPCAKLSQSLAFDGSQVQKQLRRNIADSAGLGMHIGRLYPDRDCSDRRCKTTTVDENLQRRKKQAPMMGGTCLPEADLLMA
jgi:hypothetical protein